MNDSHWVKKILSTLSVVMLGGYLGLLQAASLNEPELAVLFEQLKSAPDQETAVIFENRIWSLWFQSDSEEIDSLMQTAVKKRRIYDFNGAIEVLNEVIALNPGYPEAWNQRATVHFHQEKYENALADVAKALELEPRHFGAMAGRAIIRLQQLKPEIARQNIIEALKLHPFLPERHYFPDLTN